MALSNEQLMSLLGPASPDKRNAHVRTSDGKLVQMQVKSGAFGKFEGRAGRLKRSRKGNVTRDLTGRRYYLHGDAEEVVAYKV